MLFFSFVPIYFVQGCLRENFGREDGYFQKSPKNAKMPPKHYQKGGGGKKNAPRWVFARNERLARMARSRNPKVKACLYQIVEKREKQSMSTPPLTKILT